MQRDNELTIVKTEKKYTKELRKELPSQHSNNLSKLIKKLQQANLNQDFKTSYNRTNTIFTFARLDYNRTDISFDRKFDATDELILNAIYSFMRAGQNIFTSRRILQHLFGNVPDHFQKETVDEIEKHIDDMTYMKLSFNFKDTIGNDAYVIIDGEQYHPVAIKQSLLDIDILELYSKTLNKKIFVYQLNKKSPIFTYAENLNQITAWATKYMAVPCRKSIKNALIINYLLTKISLIKNKNNRYLNNGILFESIFDDLKLDVNTRKKKKVIRDNIKVMFDYWLKLNLITAYEFEKLGQSFYKIKFTVNLSEE